jgi:hypothetical protein
LQLHQTTHSTDDPFETDISESSDDATNKIEDSEIVMPNWQCTLEI